MSCGQSLLSKLGASLRRAASTLRPFPIWGTSTALQGIAISFLSGAVLPVKMKEDAQADVVVTTPPTIDHLVAAGKVAANTRVDFVHPVKRIQARKIR